MGEVKKTEENITFEQQVTRDATREVYKKLSKEWIDYGDVKKKKVYDECFDFDDDEKKLDKEKIRLKIKRYYKYISDLIGPEIKKYHHNEVSSFLAWYFFRDYDKPGTADILYVEVNDVSAINRIHSHMKDGRFGYNYEDFIEEFLEIVIPLEAKRDLNDMRLSLNKLTIILGTVIRDVKEASKEKLPESYLLYLRNILEDIWGRLIKAFKLAQEEVEALEELQEHQEYIGALAMGYIEIVAIGIVDALRIITFMRGEKGEVTDLLKQIESYADGVMNTLREEKPDLYRYDLKQNYAIKLWLKILYQERKIWVEIHKFLLSETELESYSKYKKEYSVEQLEYLNPEEFDKINIRSVGTQEEWELIKRCFCEDGKYFSLDLQSFSYKFYCCKTVWKWYKEQRHQNVGQRMDWRTLKAIFRELYVYTKMPDIIKSVKTENFIKLIKNGDLSKHTVMDEVETFYSFKIKRGMAREDNNLEAFKNTEVVLCCYYEYEKMLFEKEWEGRYLSKIIKCICGGVMSYKL